MSDYIFIIVGESGSGKTTIVNELEKRYGFTSIQSYTTRPKRSEDEQGHIFVSDEEFDQLKDMCAYTEFNGYRYCGTADQVEQNDLYVLDVWGIEYFKSHYKGEKEARVIYVLVSERDRKARMLNRGDPQEDTLKRLMHDSVAFSRVGDHLNYVVVNDNLDKCVKDIYTYINYTIKGEIE